MAPPIQPKRNPQDLWEEYKVIEARLHSDSKVAYAILGSFLAGSFILISAFVSTLISAAESDETTLARWALPIVTGFFAAVLVYLGSRTFTRFNETGDVRRARAVNLEKQLQISSFRMFPPWVEVDLEDYLALGEISSKVSWNGSHQSRQAFEVKGIQEYWRIQNSRRMRDLLHLFSWIVATALAFLLGIVIGAMLSS